MKTENEIIEKICKVQSELNQYTSDLQKIISGKFNNKTANIISGLKVLIIKKQSELNTLDWIIK